MGVTLGREHSSPARRATFTSAADLINVRVSPVMVLAALVLSVVAVFIAGISAWYARRQAVSTEAVGRIDAARRHGELQPTLVGEYVQVSDTREGQRPGVKLTNDGPLDLDRVEVSLVPAHRLHEAPIEGIYDHQTRGTASAHETGMLRRGESWTFEVITARRVIDGQELDRGGTARFRCICRAEGYDPWDCMVSVDFPSTPFVGFL